MVVAIGSLILGYRGMALLAGFLAMISTIIFPFLKPFTVSGNLWLRPDQIVFEKEQASNGKLVFPIAEVQKIEITYNGHKGEAYSNPRSLLPKDGSGNSMFVCHNNIVYNFELMFEKKSIDPLTQMVSQWEKLNIPITVLNKWGRKTRL